MGPLVTAALLLAPANAALAAGPAGGPASYRLTVAGTVSRGATVTTTLEEFSDIGLVVTTDDTDLGAPPALVPLGQVNPGGRTLPWNLKVNGQALGAGKYVVALEIFTANGQPTGRSFPPPAILTVGGDGRTSVVMSSASTTKTNWLVTLIVVILALVAGTVGGFFLGRRSNRTAPSPRKDAS